MSDDLVLEGTWWMPEEPQVKIGGSLRYGSGETIELLLKPSHGFLKGQEKKLSFPMIFGKLKDGSEVTLVDCTMVESEDETKLRFSVNSVLQGSQLSPGESDHSEKDYAHFLQFSSFIKKF